MNVSSVKNLNGETFSAVQDADLTTVVQTNSGNWQDITAYQNASANYLTAVNIPESADWNDTTEIVQTNSGNWDNVTNKLDTTSFSDVSSTFLTAVDLTPYQTIEGMTAYQPAGSYATTNELEQVSGDITALIPSTAGLASESYVQTNSAVLTGMIDGKQDTLTFGYDEQDRINSINNSALAGGGDVPEDVMVETNLEYNAVNEISGYNGSAIAQYGAEKQWLVHDGTLCHLSNSAQYALGVNVSAVQTLMGLDQPNQWIDVRNEVNYNSNAIAAGGFNIVYNPFLKMVNLTCDVNVKAGSVATNFMTWTERLKPATDVQFALGDGLYVSSGELFQGAGTVQRWINDCWCWGVKGE